MEHKNRGLALNLLRFRSVSASMGVCTTLAASEVSMHVELLAFMAMKMLMAVIAFLVCNNTTAFVS